MVTLLALITAKRVSSLSLLSLEEGFIQQYDSRFVLQPKGLEKHDRPGYKSTPLIIDAFLQDHLLCPFLCLRDYLERTKELRTSDCLFVTSRRPFSKATPATLARWVKSAIIQSGQWGTGGSARGVVTSTVLTLGETLGEVMMAADWTRSSTFTKFYYKAIPMNHIQEAVNKLI